MKAAIPFIIKANLVRRFRNDGTYYYNVGVQWTSWPSKRKPNAELNGMVWEAKQRITGALNREK